VTGGVGGGVRGSERVARLVVEHLTDHGGGRGVDRLGEREPEFGVTDPLVEPVDRAPKDVDVAGRAERCGERLGGVRVRVGGRGGRGVRDLRDRQRAVRVGDPVNVSRWLTGSENEERSS